MLSIQPWVIGLIGIVGTYSRTTGMLKQFKRSSPQNMSFGHVRSEPNFKSLRAETACLKRFERACSSKISGNYCSQG